MPLENSKEGNVPSTFTSRSINTRSEDVTGGSIQPSSTASGVNYPRLTPSRTLQRSHVPPTEEAPSDESHHEGWTLKELTDLMKSYNTERRFSKKVLRLLKARRMHHAFNIGDTARDISHVASAKGNVKLLKLLLGWRALVVPVYR